MYSLFLVGLGGFFGSIARYLASRLVDRLHLSPLHSLGTMSVNLLGCFLIGISFGFFLNRAHLPHDLRLLVITGFLGGFTTFSTFGLETFDYLKRGQWMLLGLHLGGNLVLGVALVALGLWLAKGWH